MPTVDDLKIATTIHEDSKAQALGAARLRGHGYDMTKLSQADIALLLNQTADDWTPEKELEMLASGKSREEVGLWKYPKRMELAASGERALSKYAQAKWLADQIQRIDPTWQPTPPAGMQPPPPSGDLLPTGEEDMTDG